MPTRPVLSDVSGLGGSLLAGAAHALARARDGAKPLHPRGAVVPAVLRRAGSPTASGVPWLDEPGTDEVQVRVSRAIGLPAPLPDIHGLAVRVPVDAGHADLLLATTGLGRVTRFLLTFTRHPHGRPLTTLLPYRGPHGPILLAARPESDLELELMWATPRGPWVSFGRLVLAATAGPDVMVSFDPLVNPLPGLGNYEWVQSLREPAYGAARAERGS